MERVISVDMKQLELTHIFIIFVYNLFHLFIFVVERFSLVLEFHLFVSEY